MDHIAWMIHCNAAQLLQHGHHVCAGNGRRLLSRGLLQSVGSEEDTPFSIITKAAEVLYGFAACLVAVKVTVLKGQMWCHSQPCVKGLCLRR
eukprot:50240-Pelagomonas_calceolata.AAC.11